MSLYNKYEELGCYEWETNYLLSLDFDSLPNEIKTILEQLGFKVSHVNTERTTIESSDEFAQAIGYKKGTYVIESQSELNKIVRDWEIEQLRKNNKPIPKKLR